MNEQQAAMNKSSACGATFGENMKATGYAGIADVVERAKALGTLSGFALGAWLIKAYEVGLASERDRAASAASETPRKLIEEANRDIKQITKMEDMPRGSASSAIPRSDAALLEKWRDDWCEALPERAVVEFDSIVGRSK